MKTKPFHYPIFNLYHFFLAHASVMAVQVDLAGWQVITIGVLAGIGGTLALILSNYSHSQSVRYLLNRGAEIERQTHLAFARKFVITNAPQYKSKAIPDEGIDQQKEQS